MSTALASDENSLYFALILFNSSFVLSRIVKNGSSAGLVNTGALLLMALALALYPVDLGTLEYGFGGFAPAPAIAGALVDFATSLTY